MPVDMKEKIAETLNQLLQNKKLDKITVKELVDACHISRQTFYYHFQDIMEVVEWRQQQTLRQAIEKSLAAACISVAMALLFPMALLAVLNPLGLTGIWLNFPGTSLLGAVLAVILLRRQWPALAAPDRPVWTDEQLAGL